MEQFERIVKLEGVVVLANLLDLLIVLSHLDAFDVLSVNVFAILFDVKHYLLNLEFLVHLVVAHHLEELDPQAKPFFDLKLQGHVCQAEADLKFLEVQRQEDCGINGLNFLIGLVVLKLVLKVVQLGSHIVPSHEAQT